MTLIKLVNSLPTLILGLIVVSIAEFYSVGLLLFTRRRWGRDRLSLNNEVAGFKFAVVGVLYAVLLAFVVVAVWQGYQTTEAAVRNEAKALVDLHQTSYALPEPAATAVREHVARYIDAVRGGEWDSLAMGSSHQPAEDELVGMSQAIFSGRPREAKEVAVYHHALDLFTIINDSRNERLDTSKGSVPTMLWVVLIAGGMITLAYPAFFGSTNLPEQVLMTACLAALVALTLLVGIVFDYPFSGDVRISLEPFERALQQMQAHAPRP